jgi:hypothetical protein
MQLGVGYMGMGGGWSTSIVGGGWNTLTLETMISIDDKDKTHLD